MNEFWKTVVASTVIAAFISGVISIVISRLQYKDTLKLNRYNKKWDLSIEVFKNLQNALTQIDLAEEMPHSDNVEDDISSALITMVARSKKKMEATKTILDQIAYLIPKERAENLINEHSKIEKHYIALLASVYNINGLPRSKIAVNIFTEEELPNQTKKYIDDVQKFSDELKDEIINALRELFGT